MSDNTTNMKIKSVKESNIDCMKQAHMLNGDKIQSVHNLPESYRYCGQGS